jgi:hypothetical protein
MNSRVSTSTGYGSNCMWLCIHMPVVVCTCLCIHTHMCRIWLYVMTHSAEYAFVLWISAESLLMHKGTCAKFDYVL